MKDCQCQHSSYVTVRGKQTSFAAGFHSPRWRALLCSSRTIVLRHPLKQLSCRSLTVMQIVKIRSKDTSITVFYHPNTMKSTKLSKNNLSSSMRFTFFLESEEASCLPPEHLFENHNVTL